MTKVEVIVLGDATLITGLSLAGLQNFITVDETSFQSSLEKVLKDEKYGIVIIQDNLIKTLDWRTKKKLDNLSYPVLVPVPHISGETKSEEDDLGKLVKRALGFDLMGNDNKK